MADPEPVTSTSKEKAPADGVLHEAAFDAGPLGITLQLSADTGAVYVATIIEDSQSCQKDIKLGDELWSIGGGSFVGKTGLDKATWLILVEELKAAPRPLTLTFLRHETAPQHLPRSSPPPKPPKPQKGPRAAAENTALPPPASTEDTEVANISAGEQQEKEMVGKEETGTEEGEPQEEAVEEEPLESLPLEELMKRLHIPEPKPPAKGGMAGFLTKASGLINQTDSQMLQPQVFTATGPATKEPGEGHGGKSGGEAVVTAHELLYKEGRHLVRAGPMRVREAGALWTVTSSRHLFLFDDVLVVAASVASPPASAGVESNDKRNSTFEVLNVENLRTCSLVSRGMDFAGDEEEGLETPSPPKSGADRSSPGAERPKAEDSRSRSSSGASSPSHASEDHRLLEIHTPRGALHCLADSPVEREVWTLALFCSICDLVESEKRVLGWRHRYLRGTLLSAVVGRDTGAVQELLGGVMESRGRPAMVAVVNAPDEDGFTALHYSCILRQLPMTKLLLEAGAHPTVADASGLSAVHWTALQLDDLSLSVLLSRVSLVDLLDAKQRTPLYVACLEGRGVTGATDVLALRRCLMVLLAMQADPNADYFEDTAEGGSKRSSPAQVLAGSWQYEALEALLEAGADPNVRDASSGYSALHYACAALPLKNAVGEGARRLAGNQSAASTSTDFEEPQTGSGLPCLQALVEAGARLNAPTKDTQPAGKPGKDADKGLSALYLLYLSRDVWAAEYEPAVNLLLEHGARVESSHELAGVLVQSCPDINFDGQRARFADAGECDGEAARLAPDCFAPTIGRDGHAAEEEMLSPADMERPHSPSGKGRSRASSSASSVEECELCASRFSFFKRRHVCRLCGCTSCDECSRHRVLLPSGNGGASSPSQCRVCDGCFNRANARLLVEEARRVSRASSRASQSAAAVAAAATATTATSAATQDQHAAATKEALFEGAAAPPSEQAQAQGGLASTKATLAEVGDRLRERGEKLERLDEKSAELSNAANDFAQMAAQLNRKSRSWF